MLHLDWNDKESLKLIQNELGDSKVILGSSDTVLGLLARANTAGNVALNTIKKRAEKPYIVLVGAVEEIEQLINPAVYCRLENFLKKCWPGPVTMVFKAHPQAASSCLASPDGTIAIRVPNHAGLLALLSKTGPLFSTSANCAGDPVPEDIRSVDPHIFEQVAAIIEDKMQRQSKAVPSTIIDLTGNPMRVLREGAFSVSLLEQLYATYVN